MAKKLAHSLKSMGALSSASFEELIAVDEIGDKIAMSIQAYFELEENRKLVERLAAHGLSMQVIEKETASNLLEGKSFVVSGVLMLFLDQN